MMHFLKSTILAVGVLGLTFFTATARADLVFNLDQTINGSTPAGVPPWLRATFHTNSTGDVTLTMENLMQSAEFTDDWLFNVQIDNSFDATSLTPTWVSGPHTTSVTLSPAQDLTGGSNLQAGLFNILFSWTTANNADRFSGGDTVVFDLTGAGITADSFDFLSQAGVHPVTGEYGTAAHVQGIPTGASGSIGDDPVNPVPELGSILQLVGVAGLLAPRLRRKLA